MLAIYPFTHIVTIMSFGVCGRMVRLVTTAVTTMSVIPTVSPETGHNIIIYHVISNGSLEADTLGGNWYSYGILVFTENGCY